MGVTLINPVELPPPRGFSHGAVGRGRLLAVAGQIGCDSDGKLVSDDFAAQFEQAAANVARVLAAAGARAEDLLSLRIYVTDKRRYLDATVAVGAAWRKHFGRHFPAMALLEVKGLLLDDALVEIEALATVGEAP
jgi:enamine deaminase RidA (YjgF/YER057c/UK114 family)